MQKKQSHWWKVGGVATAAVLCVLLGGGVANALWAAKTTHAVPAVQAGEVQFSAAGENSDPEHADEELRVYSTAGEAIELEIPGSRVIDVLEQNEPDSAPVIWRFDTAGFAAGSAGMDYTIRVTEQRQDGESYPIVDGRAHEGTVLEQSTLQVYPSGVGGDCSAIPVLPEGAREAGTNVFVHDGADVELQAPGAGVPGLSETDEWCVAMNWNNVDDGLYKNDVQVNATGEDGSASSGIAQWFSRVGTPPALEMLGQYLSEVLAVGMGEDSTEAKDSDQWGADVYPDPSNEPSVVLSFTPVVTSSADSAQ